MWIGFAVVVLVSGQVVTYSTAYRTELECKKEAAQVTEMVQKREAVFAFHVECADAEKYLTIRKGTGS